MADEVVLEPVETGDELEIETPEVEGEEVETETDGEETPEGEGTEVEGEDDAHDGRKLPQKVREALKAFKDASPENTKVANTLRDAFGRATEYEQIFPKVQDARVAQQTIQSVGGVEGVQAMQAKVADFDEVDSLLAEGNPEVLDRIAEIAGEGLNKLVPDILSRMQSSSPEAYAAALKPFLYQGLVSTGLPAALHSIFENLQTARNTPGATPEFKKHYEDKADATLVQLSTWLQKLSADATQPPAAKNNDALTARETALNQREETAFQQDLRKVTSDHQSATLGKELAPYLKKLNLDPEAKIDLAQGIYDECARLIGADKTYKGQIDAAMKGKKRDATKISALMNAKVDAVAATAVKNVIGRRYKSALGTTKPVVKGAVKPGVKPAVQKPGAPIKVAVKPDRSQFDMSKTTQDMLVRGQAVLTNGKLVAWR